MRLLRRLEPELRQQNITGLVLQILSVEKYQANRDWPKKAASRVGESLDLVREGERLQVDDLLIKCSADGAENCSYHLSYSAHSPENAAAVPLEELLRKKHDQLDVIGHQRVLVVVNAGCLTDSSAVSNACAVINFRLYPNFDQIYFEEYSGKFSLVYDREAWLCLEAGKLPATSEVQSLFVRWLEFRLSIRWLGSLNTALLICWDLRGCEWLSERGRAALVSQAQLVIHQCGWEAPRKLWELFLGPLPTRRSEFLSF